MLVLSRKEGERIMVGDNIVITIVRIQGGNVRIGIEAPPEVLVLREGLERHSDDAAQDDPRSEVES